MRKFERHWRHSPLPARELSGSVYVYFRHFLVLLRHAVGILYLNETLYSTPLFSLCAKRKPLWNITETSNIGSLQILYFLSCWNAIPKVNNAIKKGWDPHNVTLSKYFSYYFCYYCNLAVLLYIYTFNVCYILSIAKYLFQSSHLYKTYKSCPESKTLSTSIPFNKIKFSIYHISKSFLSHLILLFSCLKIQLVFTGFLVKLYKEENKHLTFKTFYRR